MATRFYLPSTGAAAASPAFDASWEGSTGATRRACVTTRINTAMASQEIQEASSTTNNLDYLGRQYVSAQIGAQTITGTLKARARTIESDAATNLISQIVVRVVSADGSTVRGTLYAGDTSGVTSSEWATADYTNRSFPRVALAPVTLSSVDAQAGDRIVIEMGARARNTVSGVSLSEIIFGDNSGTDLAEDETTTTANNPWVEFSQTLTFGGAAASLAASPKHRARTKQGELLQL